MRLCFREALENLRRSPFAEKHMSIVLAIDSRVGPNTQDRAEHFTVATGHLL